LLKQERQGEVARFVTAPLQRQKADSFNMDDVMEKLKESSSK